MLRSTQNLIVNGGFSRALNMQACGWQVVGGAANLRPVRAFDAAGLPHASQALELPGACLIRQPLMLPALETERWVLRITARAPAGSGQIRLAMCAAEDRQHATTFGLSAQWQRCRMEATLAPASACVVEIGVDPGQPPVEITDVRLVGLRQTAPGFSIRFETKGRMLLPSTRLRALMIEDYLNLLGWPTSVNGGTGGDLLVCQKVTRFARLLAARLGGARVIYDLDDNELAGDRLRAARVRLFARLVDGVTTGGDFLNARLSRPGAPAYLLDNPVDLLDPDLRHDTQVWRGRIVWFGMPENAWMIDALDLPDRVVKITRGGDVDYDLRTIDQQLISHDLALLPLTLTEHTQAKNANRMVKCVGLGLPFLASDTPEHRRALARLGMGDHVLVRAGEAWADRIADVRRDYADWKAEVAAARPAAFAAYGIEAIVDGWLDYCERVRRRAG